MGQTNEAPVFENGEPFWKDEFPELDHATLIGTGKPTEVSRGLFKGFSLPVYAAANEELFGTANVPLDWDGASDFYVHVLCYLAGAEDTKNFKLQCSWEHYAPGPDIVPATSADVEVETATGAAAAQFQSYKVAFQMTYGDLARDDVISMRLRRIAASANEAAGEIVIGHWSLPFRRNILGGAAP